MILSTWWWSFQKRVVCTKFDINIGIYYPKYTTSVNCREGNAYSAGALEFTFGF
jgi:hypothetical protein